MARRHCSSASSCSGEPLPFFREALQPPIGLAHPELEVAGLHHLDHIVRQVTPEDHVRPHHAEWVAAGMVMARVIQPAWIGMEVIPDERNGLVHAFHRSSERARGFS